MRFKKQYILFPLLLLIFLVLLQRTLDTLYKRKSEDKISLIMKHDRDAEIMIFGSSVANAQFSPIEIEQGTGLSVYNMGWDGVFFTQYNGLIKEYLRYQNQCKCIVIACDFDNLGKNELITRPDLFYAYLDNKYVYESLHDIQPQQIALARYLPGYKFTLLKWTYYRHLLYSSRDKNRYRGYIARHKPWEVIDSTTKITGRFDPTVYKKLQQTLSLITQKGIKIILVIPPVYKTGYKLITNAEEIKSYYHALQKGNVFYIDYTTDTICLNRNHFYNFGHMNGDGASVFSKKFAGDLRKILDSAAATPPSGAQ
jgi:hypothetical protein